MTPSPPRATCPARQRGGSGEPGVRALHLGVDPAKPKGVAVEHRNVVNYVRGVAGRLGLPAGSSYAWVSTFSADLPGNTVLFPPLCLGGTLHVIPEDLATDPGGLGAYFQREGIDCLKIVPSHLSALLAGAHPERVLPRRLLVHGGEGASWELVQRVARLAPGMRLLNHYGPTETTVGVTTFAVDEAARARLEGNTAVVPLGRPLPNTRIYVLDAARAPVPVGVPGEVYVGGAGVARGYLAEPELTRERFVPDPFGARVGDDGAESGGSQALPQPPRGRLYRTGDRARWLADGTLVFLGRVDFQVKIRGHRVELGEIEATLAAHPAVKDVVVLALGETAREQRLAAYVVPVTPGAASVADLQRHLGERLPDVMVPSSLVFLAALPLTPNGKVDRRALAALGREHDQGTSPPRPARPSRRCCSASGATSSPERGGGPRSVSTTASRIWAATRSWPSRSSRARWMRSRWRCRCAPSSRRRRSPGWRSASRPPSTTPARPKRRR